jgi:ABC-2 type transport system permease protein
MAERFYDQHPEWRPKLTAPGKVSPAVLRFARAAELERALAPIEARFEQARTAREAWVHALRWISPASVAHDSFAVIAGSDALRHARFVASVRQHQLELRRYFQARLQKAALADEANPCKHVTGTCADGFGFTDHLAVPRFAASPALATSGQTPLALWGLLLVGVAFAALGLVRGREGQHLDVASQE